MNIKAWSFSALSTFETCPLRSKYQKLDKVPELSRPGPASGEHANDRGTRIHDNLEQYVRGKAELTKELILFKEDIDAIKPFFAVDQVELEGMWCFNNAWVPVHEQDYSNIWLRVKLDVFVLLSDTRAVVIDLKTGKRYGNEVKHAQQTQLYALASFLRFPDLQEITTELWYPDVDELASMEFTRTQGLRFFKSFNDRGTLMTSTTDFKPKPSQSACMFCPYAAKESSNRWVNKSGHCPYGV